MARFQQLQLLQLLEAAAEEVVRMVLVEVMELQVVEVERLAAVLPTLEMRQLIQAAVLGARAIQGITVALAALA